MSNEIIQPRASSPENLQVTESDLSAELRSAAAPKHVNILLLLHSLLRGRYWVAIPLAVVGMIIGAAAGYTAVKPNYRSWGQLRIRPYLPKIIFDDESKSVMPMFEAYMDAQIAQIRSPRMLAQAMQDPRWKEVGRGLTPRDTEVFVDSLEVTHEGELLTISFTDKEANAAFQGVNAVIDSYRRSFGDLDSENSAERMETLERYRDGLEAEMKRYDETILAIGKELGSTALQKDYDHKLEMLYNAEAQLRLAELARAAGEARYKAMGQTGAVAAAVSADTLREYVAQKKQMQARIDEMSLGMGENHPSVTRARAFVANLDSKIDAILSGKPGAISPADNLLAAANLQELRETESNIRQIYDGLKAETVELGRKNVQIEDLRGKRSQVQQRFTEARERIEKLKVEENVGGRLSIIRHGEMPYKPHNDRRIPLAGAGGFAGTCLGFAIVLAIGYFDRRLRHIGDAKSRLPRVNRLLGVLPSMPDEGSSPEQEAFAAHCVHQVRTMLQIQQGTTGHRVLAVTSPSPGDGKTSLTLALGMSFAATGTKTLLIDSDFHGGGLTSRLGSSTARRLGQILIRDKCINEQQLQRALERAHSSGKKLGEVLIEQSLASQEVVDHALAAQHRLQAGLLAALEGTPIGDCVMRTSVSNLHLLPLGSDAHLQAGQVSPVTIRQVLDEAAKHYDTVLVDTGPILGSLEAAVVAAEVDGVVLTVSRGGQRTLAQNAINYLATMDAELEGIVFNRADDDDIVYSGFSSSASMASARSSDRMNGGAPNGKPNVKRLGPVVTAVVGEKRRSTPGSPPST